MDFPELAGENGKGESSNLNRQNGTVDQTDSDVDTRLNDQRRFNSASQNINDFYFFDEKFKARKLTAAEQEKLKNVVTSRRRELEDNFQKRLEQSIGQEKSEQQINQKEPRFRKILQGNRRSFTYKF